MEKSKAIGISETEGNLANKISRGGLSGRSFPMSFSDWMHNASARGCVAAILCAYFSINVLAQPVGDNFGRQPSTTQTQEQAKADGIPLILDAIKSEIEGVRRATEALKDESDPKQKEEKDRRDLVAQEALAFWAMCMFWAAIATVVLTVVGLGMLLGTLIYTKQATNAARDMVAEGRKATEGTVVAANAAKAAGEASVAAERARFFIAIDDYNFSAILNDHVHHYDEHGIFGGAGRASLPKITYRFRNYGKTPGILKEISMDMRFGKEPEDCVYPVTITSLSESMVGAGDSTKEKEHSMLVPLDVEQAAAIATNEYRLWFFGRVDYDDVLGGPSHTHRFFFRTVMWEGECILQPYDYKHYNQST